MTTKPVWFPSNEYKKSTRLYHWMEKLGFDEYESFLEKSTQDISWFWMETVKELGVDWFKHYDQVLDLSKGIKWPEWFVGGQLNIVHEALEKWANHSDTKDEIALIWEGDSEKETRTFTFNQLSLEVGKAASGLRQSGINKGDVITIYMPMIPETVIVMLATAKLGAIISPTFSGYGADAVATRLNAAKSKMLITADGFMRRGKEVKMKEEADKAVDLSPSVEKVVVVRRLARNIALNERDIDWDDLTDTLPLKHTEQMESHDPIMLIYTSGTTGRPKGAVHTHAGFPLKAAFDAGICMDVNKGDSLFWYTDMGWMMGPFLVFGGLINGASIVMFEGTPDFPNPDRLWKVVENHGVTHLGISPTLIRSLMQHGQSWVENYRFDKLRLIGSTGEPWNPEPWFWLFNHVGKQKVPIFNYSGGTEISGGILGNVLVKPIGPITFNSPIPGMAVHVYNDEGKPVKNEVGELVITQPWVGMTRGFWNEPERYEKAYWDRWSDTWVHGDWVIEDDDGFWTITGRSDDILNVAGKRLGPAEVESILVAHDAVVEAGTIGIPDEVKGEVAVCFAVIAHSWQPSDQLRNELMALVAEKLGKALRPKEIYFVTDLPKTRNAKVMRRAIKSAYLDKESGDLSSLVNPDVVESIRDLGKKHREIRK